MFTGPGTIGSIGYVSGTGTSGGSLPPGGTITTPGTYTFPIGSRTDPLSLTIYADFVDVGTDAHNSYEIRIANSPSDPVIARVFADREQHTHITHESFDVLDNAGTLELVVNTQGSGATVAYHLHRVTTQEL